MKGLIITLVLLGCAAFAAEGVAAEIALRENAAVGRGFVRMADLVTVSGCGAEITEKIRQTFCGSAPEPGEERIISLAYIKMRLAQNAFDVASFGFKGAGEVRVTSAAVITVTWPGDEPRDRSLLTTLCSSEDETGTLEERLVSHIKKLLAEKEAANPLDIEATINSLSRAIKSAPADSEIASIRQVGHRGSATSAIFIVELVTKGKKRLRGSVVARVNTLSYVAVAAREIEANREIAAEDIEMAKMPVTGNPRNYYRSKADVVGMKTLKKLSKGEALLSAAVDRPVVLKHGDIINVEVRIAGKDISVKTTGIALQSGRVGETIKVRNASSGKEFMARVVGNKNVEVVIGEEK